MKSATKKDTKKSPGRPATGIGIQIGTRWPADIVRLVDEWRRAHPDLPGRPEAIRRLVEMGLTIKTKAKQPSAARAARAKELAAKAIDKMIDPSAPPEERSQRRRRLIKGPTEFREDRVDLPIAKGK